MKTRGNEAEKKKRKEIILREKGREKGEREGGEREGRERREREKEKKRERGRKKKNIHQFKDGAVGLSREESIAVIGQREGVHHQTQLGAIVIQQRVHRGGRLEEANRKIEH